MKVNQLKVGNVLWMGIKGASLSLAEKKFIEKEEISGLVLFKKNIVSLKQLYELCQEIKSLNPPPLIAIDREGGSVDRFKHLEEIPAWPSPKQLVQVASLKEIQYTVFLMASELYSVGIHINLAPCLDIEHVSSVLFENRLLGACAAVVQERGVAFLKGLKQAGVIPCVKHFPGHGAVTGDSHDELPVDARSIEQIQKTDLLVFNEAIKQGVPLIMTAHVLYSQWDSHKPATLSQKILTHYLKSQMHFQGLIISDDLDMKALSHFKQVELPILALTAGVDILLQCQSSSFTFEIPEILRQTLSQEATFRKTIELKIKKIQQFKKEVVSAPPISFVKWKRMITDVKRDLWAKTLCLRLKAGKNKNVMR